MRRDLIAASLAAALSSLAAVPLAAADASFTVSGSALGTLDGTPFETGFVFVVEADLANYATLPATAFFDPVDRVTFTIEGFAPVTLIGDYYFGVNNENNVFFLGLESDIFDFEVAAAPDLLRSFGPLAGGDVFGLESFSDIPTSGGSLSISRADAAFVTGVVEDQPVIPEPATWALLIAGFGLVGVAARRARPRASGGRGAA